MINLIIHYLLIIFVKKILFFLIVFTKNPLFYLISVALQRGIDLKVKS
ncbi:hypothetical protein JCM15765_45600 [Paradesulfitobacterium aromaticivorans]